jgi:hypothetical protein
MTDLPLPEMVANEFQQKSSTVMWWYQCREIRGFLRRTMKTVSINSGILENMKSMTQNPVVPTPQDSSGDTHTVFS